MEKLMLSISLKKRELGMSCAWSWSSHLSLKYVNGGSILAWANSKSYARLTMASDDTDSRNAGRLFGSNQGSNWWDDNCAFHPIVVKDPSPSSSTTSWTWRMYYYGRDKESWNVVGDTRAPISTGRIGLATSMDGVRWSKYRGPLHGGAIMDPNQSLSSFDCVHIGCSDVLWHQGLWWMYYFGGNLEEVLLGANSLVGFKLRTGLATSVDGIHGFQRSEDPILDVGTKLEWDEIMVAWARVMPPPLTLKLGRAPWLMTYCSLDATCSQPCFTIGAALSEDGVEWRKVGKVLEKGSASAWDGGGVGRRHVVEIDGLYYMFYEGVDAKGGRHGIGLATSQDGLKWEKDRELGGEPGGPVFSSRIDDASCWDSGGVAAPHVVRIDDKHFGLYYVGSDSSKKISAMGLALSNGLDVRRWTRVSCSQVV